MSYYVKVRYAVRDIAQLCPVDQPVDSCYRPHTETWTAGREGERYEGLGVEESKTQRHKKKRIRKYG